MAAGESNVTPRGPSSRNAARQANVCHTRASGVGVTPFGAPLLYQTTTLAPSSAYRGALSTAGDSSEVSHGSDALHRRSFLLYLYRATPRGLHPGRCCRIGGRGDRS